MSISATCVLGNMLFVAVGFTLTVDRMIMEVPGGPGFFPPSLCFCGGLIGLTPTVIRKNLKRIYKPLQYEASKPRPNNTLPRVIFLTCRVGWLMSLVVVQSGDKPDAVDDFIAWAETNMYDNLAYLQVMFDMYAADNPLAVDATLMQATSTLYAHYKMQDS